ncbi:RNA polymerase factor sigma-54 [Raoultella ornithinolytica]|nr:RNA polymerase factor sigma-54 [Raoultella ornithinolytica]
MRVTRLKEEVLKEAVNLIQSLDPRPGQSIQTSEPEYVIPDVLVRKVSGRWVVELNSDSIPRLKINQHYAAMGNSRAMMQTASLSAATCRKLAG